MRKTIMYTVSALFLSLGVRGQQAISLSSYGGQGEITALKSITLTNGFHIPSGSNVRLYLLSAPLLTSTPSSNQNYILSRTFRRPGVTAANMDDPRSIAEENQTVQYFDGLGRPLQTVDLMASPGHKDIVQHIEYDGFGRESRKYLPYVHADGNGAYKTGGSGNVNTFYTRTTGDDISGIVRTPKPYAETVFENSPLNRVLEQGAPGQAWQPSADRGAVTTASSTGHTVAMDYGTNVAGDVRLWAVNSNNLGASGTPYYAAGKLYRTVTKDENWITSNGKGGTVEEYRDFEDRVVLKRVWKSNTEALNTYYVYDDFGDLRYVIPPGYTTATVTDNNTDFNELVYAYRYDGRRRLVEKKVPGKYWEYIVYNRNDQPILTQDSVQRAAKKWSYTKYDAFGRVASTGIYNNVNAATRKQVQAWADLKVPQWEDRIGTANYTLKSFPDTLARLQELTVSYYDDYTFANAATLPEQGISKSLKIKTLLTGMKVSKDDGTAPLLTVNYYDDRGRLIQSVSQNHLNGTDRITNEYTFVGELTKSTRVHIAKGVTTTMVTTNSYDHVGRLTASKHYINDPQNEVTLAEHEYNEIGQLKKKSVGGDKDRNNYHTAVDYAYNERGWATGASSPQFTYQLNYNVNSTGTVLAGAQYNGNIAQQLWGHGAATNSTFSYSYDRLNRLTNGTSTGTTVMIEALTYDDMGNIKTLSRNTGNTTATTSTTFTYNNSNKSNRLASLSGNTNTYLYDANGNTTRDRTGMTIRYNHLSLPDSVYNASVRVGYLYDAMGAKLRKYSNQGGNRDYVGGIEYNGNNIELIHMGEGVAYRNTSNNTYTYRYNLTDHLGNVRSTVYRNPANNNAVEVLQKDDYYPFGKQRVVAAGNNKYLYNGKELQGELGGQYDYGARFYDADIGRWNVVDPLGEKYFNHSPYNYVLNNPIDIIDPDGKDIIILSYGDKQPGHKYGHIAILIGNQKDGWTYYSKDGDSDGSYTNKKGEVEENNTFTIAQFKSIDDFASSEHNTFKSDYDDVYYGQEPFANSERDDKGNLKQRYEKAFFLKTSTTEDAVMKKTADKTTATDYETFLNNCVDNVEATLKIGGFKTGSGNGLDPSEKFQDIKKENKGGTDISSLLKPKKK
ncbi:RHS repeat-associated core domain-containing protein [Sphingobacterium alkalisoli]|uniref:RHS repeat-associated core domain-containing protein n=1 Tax=Sphingobacterium alkalisoli TaxID=1874115 RepID=A0A4V5LX01_9SPHI|nr:DUF6443 domain-containing protein [Sphingobacterium alkalisoli]TJY60709.1 RHS repeat-associated core domain-containing protein [Sphingobacterium alkalisoli]GGH31476.1 hypothetical protein GCM10011418_44310 [Sphingobacterium alkalisoli]